MKNLSRKGGKSDVRWTGPYSIIVIHEKGLYSLQNCNGKMLAKKINGSRLKLYHEHKGNCSNVSSQQVLDYRDEDEDIQILTEKCTTLPDDVQNEEGTQNKKLSAVISQCALKENSKEVTGYKQDEDDFTIHSKDSLLTTKANSSLDDQLYSSHLLRLWRTGAVMLAYCADKDEFDPSSMHFNEDEFALSRDLMVDLWLQSRQYDESIEDQQGTVAQDEQRWAWSDIPGMETPFVTGLDHTHQVMEIQQKLVGSDISKPNAPHRTFVVEVNVFEQDKVNHWLKGKHKQTLLLFSDLVVVAKKNKD
ncbi:hypothetical protein EMCRGX_G000762 [Ephydatia muelleri]